MKISKLAALFMSLLLTLGIFAGCALDDNGESGKMINATIILVLEDGTEVKHDINVKGNQTIRQALYEAGLIDKENKTSMFVTTIDGHTADPINDGVTWLPCDENGNELTGGKQKLCMLDSYKVMDGQTIKLVYFTVPDFDD